MSKRGPTPSHTLSAILDLLIVIAGSIALVLWAWENWVRP